MWGGCGYDGEAWVAKYDGDNGEFIWREKISSNANDWSEAIAVDSKGGVYITGITEVFLGDSSKEDRQNLGWDTWVAKLDGTDGDVEWSRQYSTSDDERSRGIAVDGEGNVYITGYVSYRNKVTNNAPGNVLSGALGSNWGFLGSLFSSNDNPGVVKHDTNGNDPWVVKYDTNGNYEWLRKIRSDSGRERT